MKVRAQAVIVTYLTIWTTAVASLAILMIRPLYPELFTSVVRIERDLMNALPGFAPFIVAPVAFGEAMSAIRKRNAIDVGMLVGYFIGAPVCIYFTLLIIVSLITVIFAPITFVLGLIYGTIPLLVGIAIHCLGMVPLFFLDRWLQSPARVSKSA
ncbi:MULTISPECIES: hypothetical protein [unclassified Bradyrhizobium]|uniref:hypothetical protein n=1 Tax=unclassified Bradyrhizobium TaxID=2631580 RepID=UPI0028E3B977|nr:MULTISPECIES: hypothetical protein [unclassified Bradyrhizobium]